MLNFTKINPAGESYVITHVLVTFSDNREILLVLAEGMNAVNIENGQIIHYAQFVGVGEDICSFLKKALYELYKYDTILSIVPVWLVDVSYQDYPLAD